MVPPIVRLLGTAILLDALLIGITNPLSRVVMSILIPATLVVGSGILWTYALVIFTVVLVIMLFLLWMFEGYYAHLFSFWQLVITMLLVMVGYLWWNKGF